jgi:hypothetical protein
MFHIGERNRVFAAKARIAILRCFVVAPGLSHGPVKAVHADIGQTVSADQLADFLDLVICGQKL